MNKLTLLLILLFPGIALPCPAAVSQTAPLGITCPSFPCMVQINAMSSASPTPSPTPVPPSPSPTLAPTPIKPSPTPVATPAPSCISITAPAPNALVSGTVTISTADTCPGVWFETVMVDGGKVGDFPLGKIQFNSTSYPDGSHMVQVTAQTENPNTTVIGTAAESLDFQNQNPVIPTPAPAASPVPPPTTTHFGNVGPMSSRGPVNTDATCATAADASGYPETNSSNVNDGTGWDYNNQIWTTPAYFYANAGRNGLAPAGDFAEVDGHYSGSTQDILRWAACKWGVDEDWVYAETDQEHGWQQSCAQMHGGTGCMAGGDCNNPDSDSGGETPSLTFMGYPVTNSNSTFVGINGLGQSNGVQACSGNWASWGIIQSKVGNFEWYTWPMIALSTAWNEDYRWAKWRACMDGDYAGWFGQNQDYLSAVSAAQSTPGGPTAGSAPKYLANETNLQYLALGCLAAHFSGQWYDSGAQNYASSFVSTYLNPKNWPGQMGHKRK